MPLDYAPWTGLGRLEWGQAWDPILPQCPWAMASQILVIFLLAQLVSPGYFFVFMFLSSSNDRVGKNLVYKYE